MSLINRMLMDLEKRRAPRPEGVLSQARALPAKATRYPHWQFAVLALAVAAAVFTWVVMQRGIKLPALPFANAPVQTQITEPAQPAKKEETPPPQTNVSTPQAAAPTAPAQTMEKVITENPVVSESLLGPASRLSTELSTVPQESATRPVVSKSAAKATGSAQFAAVAKAKSAEQPSSTAISKQVRQETPQQLAEVEYRKAVLSLQQGQPIDAQDGFRRALQLDPNFTAARLGLSGLLLQGRQIAEAESVLRAGLELDSREPGFAMMMARVQLEKDDMQAALETLRKTLPYANRNADYQAFMAALLLQNARYTDAVEHYQIALSLKPTGVWYMGLGISLQALRRLPEAQDAFQKAMDTGALTPELQAFVEQRLKQVSTSKNQGASG